MCGDLYAVNLTQSSASRRIAKFLLSGTMVNCRAMCESLFIQSTCILSTLFLSVFGKFAEFCFVYSVENLVKALNNFMGSFISCALSSNRSDFLDLDNLVDFTCILVQWHRQHKRDVSLAIKDSVQSNDFVSIEALCNPSFVPLYNGNAFLALFLLDELKHQSLPVGMCRDRTNTRVPIIISMFVLIFEAVDIFASLRNVAENQNGVVLLQCVIIPCAIFTYLKVMNKISYSIAKKKRICFHIRGVIFAPRVGRCLM